MSCTILKSPTLSVDIILLTLTTFTQNHFYGAHALNKLQLLITFPPFTRKELKD